MTEEQQLRANYEATLAATAETKKRGEMYEAVRDFFVALTDMVVMVRPALQAQASEATKRAGGRA